MKLERIHHVAYRCKDAKETVNFYQRVLNMEFQLAFAEDQVPSTKEPDPYMHVFLDAGMGNVLAFFELPTKKPMDRDHNTPQWVQHIAFEVKDYDELLASKEKSTGPDDESARPRDHVLYRGWASVCHEQESITADHGLLQGRRGRDVYWSSNWRTRFERLASRIPAW